VSSCRHLRPLSFFHPCTSGHCFTSSPSLLSSSACSLSIGSICLASLGSCCSTSLPPHSCNSSLSLSLSHLESPLFRSHLDDHTWRRYSVVLVRSQLAFILLLAVVFFTVLCLLRRTFNVQTDRVFQFPLSFPHTPLLLLYIRTTSSAPSL
jgi:hypothetical protein